MISEKFQVTIGEDQVEIFKHTGLPKNQAFLSSDLYDLVFTYFKKQSEKTTDLANAIFNNESDKPIS